MATILIVDDVAANRAFLVTLLGYRSHKLVEAAHGADALIAARTERPDLIISDVLMPVMDGYEFVRQLRLDPRSQAVPVILYTAHYGEREARELAASLGVAEVLTKPAEPEVVLSVVDRLLTGGATPVAIPPAEEFDREHLRLITDKLSEKVEDLRRANARLSALINISLELASERDSARLLQNVCDSARELFGASYVTLGITDRETGWVRRHFVGGVTHSHGIALDAVAPGLLRVVISERRVIRGVTSSGDPAELGLSADHPRVQAYLIAPVASPSFVYGWILLVGNEGRGFAVEDESLLRALGGQVGRIYENGYFYAMARHRADELELEVAERARAQLALQQERDRAQRYLDTAEVILLALDKEGLITLVNRYACTLLGWTHEELVGQSWVRTCVPERLRETVRDRFQRLLDGDAPLAESPVLTRSGEERLVVWRSTTVRDAEGHVIGTFSSGTDITERERAIDALRAAEERMRFALESAGVAIWDMDYETGELSWSPIFERQHGFQPGDFAGTFDAYMTLIHPDDRPAVLAIIEDAATTGEDFSIQYRTLLPDGTLRWLVGAGRIRLGEAGAPQRGVGVTLDVTEMRSLEQQYQRAQKMEAIGRLAGGIAHDFNNLLTAILGGCDLLLADLAADDSRRADIEEIQRAGVRATSLTRQLLAFSRKQIIEPTLVELNAVVTDMRALIGRLIGEDVRITLRLAPHVAPVLVDRGQIEQVLMNLAINARDAMPHGGALSIETSMIDLDEEYARTHLGVKPGRYVALRVSDNGTGMTEEVKSRLFEPFFTTKEEGKGTGLGLATVHGIVARAGGSILVYSEPGMGTTFHIYFPEAAGEVVQAAPATPPARPAVRHKVLVVEDAEDLRDLTRRLLDRIGYEALTAANAEEAIRLFHANPGIDVLLTDVVMPGASGPQLTQRLLDERPGLRVIFMSGYTEDAVVEQGIMNRDTTFLQKPFTADSLARKLHDLLAR